MPNQTQLDKEREQAFDEFFAKVQVKLQPDFKFNRDELYDRPKAFLTDE